MNFLKNLIIDPGKASALRLAKQAGAAYEFAQTKGGHNRKTWNGRKKGEKRIKKVAYKWGTLGAQQTVPYPPPSRRGQSHKVIRQIQKAEAYKIKCRKRAKKRA